MGVIDSFVTFPSVAYAGWLVLLLISRGLDFLSTWLATPNLVLEANPIARRLGWKWGSLVNLALCCSFAFWPFPALVIATTSLLVAARNFQSSWLMRLMGEQEYQSWMGHHLRQCPRSWFAIGLLAQCLIHVGLGIGLFLGGWNRLVPMGIGAGMFAYGIAVLLYTTLSVWRLWRGPV